VFEDRLSQEGREKHAAVHVSREVPGEDLGRIISLTDGVFAFALTLLVLGLTVPNVMGNARLGSSLQADWPIFLGYAFAFVMITIWWMAHHRTFRYIQRYDFVLMWLNTALLLEVAIMPFVLEVFGKYPGDQDAAILFAVVQIAAGSTLNLMWRYASSGHRLIDPKLDKKEIDYFARRGLIAPAVFAVSIAITFVSVSFAEYFWIGALVLQRFSTRYGVG